MVKGKLGKIIVIGIVMLFIGTSLATFSSGHSIKNSIDNKLNSNILDNIILQDPITSHLIGGIIYSR